MEMKENANLTLTTVPTPTNEYRTRRKLRRLTQSPGTPQGVNGRSYPGPCVGARLESADLQTGSLRR